MTSGQLRQKFLDFFADKGHAIIPSASLLPENDPTVLFNTAGMQPLVPYFLGEAHPLGRRLANAQKCLRTDDIDEVGDPTHLTFFEMLGNWSLGDYFQQESITWSWEFLTSPKWLGLSPDRLAATVFVGDQDAPFDQVAYQLWQDVGLPPERLAKLGKKDNWWGPAGQTGPCGTDTEIFYWTGAELAPTVYDPQDKRWVEIWNNVFMSYNKQADGSFQPLVQPNVDTGLGLERVLATLNNQPDVYLNDIFQPTIVYLEQVSGLSYADNPKPLRIIADHLRASLFLLADEKAVTPGNKDQGYILRRLIRRAIRLANNWSVPVEEVLIGVAKAITQTMGEAYPELLAKQEFIISELKKEIEKFKTTLDRGLKELQLLIEIGRPISGVEAFMLYQSYGFPLEMTKELASESDRQVDEIGFQAELAKHQELSRTAAAGKFKGGLADDSVTTTRLHTAAHLLLQALRQVLGADVYQRGSNITAERLRFDFSYPDKMTAEQINQVEEIVNQQIALELPVACQEVSLDEARRQGAMGIFDAKYGERVKVYTIGAEQPFSQEICGGPHVQNTSDLGRFRIIKEESSSAGVRRIKAILE
ncbi:alanine--tRNA ligase [Candidatus Falkowbacteria bacterium]|nr:alanine--tRNA ligase [Candidatus Falkowbacteria bacterium]